MSKPPQKAPTGEWSMPKDKLLRALGQFVMSWAAIEATIEVGIGKQLGTAPLETSIVTAGLMFRPRAAILMSLLNRDPTANAEAIQLLKEIERIEDRNDIMHSVIVSGEDFISFNRRKTKAKFNSKIERYSQIRLNSTVLHIADLASRLTLAMGISKEDYVGFFQQSHNAVNNSDESG